MFESEDFDLDEDFLKDIGEKEEEYYSQKQIPKIHETSPKKVESLLADIPCDISFDDEPDFAKITNKSKDSIEKTDVSFQRKNDENCESINQNNSKNSKILSDSLSKKNIQKSRKRLALEILKKGCERGVRSNKERNWNFEKKSNIINAESETCDSDISTIFKKPKLSNKSVDKVLEKSASKLKSNERYPRITLVRKFPGPAGLLPDDPDENFDQANLSNRLEDGNSEIIDDNNDSGISDYFSQDTERLFSCGAWRSMIDDLPRNFLRGHEIGTIKKRAGSNSRAPFLAGVIHRIDHSVENPRLVLKDLGDSIEGTMHRDISMAHPNIFEPGVVVLLRDVGILGFHPSPNFPSLQFHVMIAPKNLVAVYSERSRLVTSPWMESVVKNDEGSKKVSIPSERFISPKKQSVDNNKMDISDFESDEDEFSFHRLNKEKEEIKNLNLDTSSSKWIPEMEEEIEQVEKIDTETKKELIPTKTSWSAEKIEKRSTESSNATDFNIKPKKIGSIRSKLMQFQFKDSGRSSVHEKLETKISSLEENTDVQKDENIPGDDISDSKGFGEDLLESDNDTDDEILSQLDVDSIVTGYNTVT